MHGPALTLTNQAPGLSSSVNRHHFHRYCILFLIWVQLFGRGAYSSDEQTSREYYKKLAKKIHQQKLTNTYKENENH
jgi:hypothetical protein